MSSLVFIYPQHIEFPETFESQNISIFNPYEFPVHFHLQCTRPTAFLLSSTEGEILAKHSLEISVSLLDKTIVEEKFQVRINLAGKGKKLGEKIIKVTLKTDRASEDEQRKAPSKVDHFQELSPPSYEQAKPPEHTHPQADKVLNEYLVYAALLTGICILLLPHEGDAHSSPNRLLEVSVNLKIAAAYVLGMVTVFLIRN